MFIIIHLLFQKVKKLIDNKFILKIITNVDEFKLDRGTR